MSFLAGGFRRPPRFPIRSQPISRQRVHRGWENAAWLAGMLVNGPAFPRRTDGTRAAVGGRIDNMGLRQHAQRGGSKTSRRAKCDTVLHAPTTTANNRPPQPS
jgi:hypothetical protein